MLSESVVKIVLTKIDPRSEGSSQFTTPKDPHNAELSFSWEEEDEELMPDCPERNLVIYHLLRMVRDLYINSKDGGQTGAYRKQSRSKRKSALSGIINRSEDPFSFRWSCRVLGFDPDKIRNRVLFDVADVAELMRTGAGTYESEDKECSRKSVVIADVWSWNDAPAQYKLSEKKGHFVVKMSKIDATSWLSSLQDSPLDFSVERFDLNTEYAVLILRHI